MAWLNEKGVTLQVEVHTYREWMRERRLPVLSRNNGLMMKTQLMVGKVVTMLREQLAERIGARDTKDIKCFLLAMFVSFRLI